jgi:eukaryotic-like serine/threonine-protein kinase
VSERWDRVTSLFAAARVLAPPLRDSFLRIACEGDDGLRADVEALLSTDVEDDTFLADPPWAVLDEALVERSLAAGQILSDRYRVEEELATGGQARVYRATDELLNRPVVIKLMRGDSWQRRLLQSRFEHEMQALAQIEHPSVVGILDIGELDDGSPFLVIQHIAGVSLREALAQGPMARPRIAAILREAGAALSAAHALGIAHRDLKPENIMLQRLTDGTELVKLIDFGIAKVEKSARASNTNTVMVAGTIRYMAPEQFHGEHSSASDVYALGLIACEMLSGQPDPFASEVPLTVRGPVLSALSYRPQDRPPKASEWCNQLAEALSGTPQKEEARPATVVRSRVPIAALMATLLGAIVAAGALMYLRDETLETRAANLSLPAPDGATVGSFAVSPDGRRIAVVASDSAAKTRLWVRDFASDGYQPLEGTEGASSPFWSADKRYIGFFAGGKLKKIKASGGPPQVICSAEVVSHGGAWNRDDVILFRLNPATPLYRVSAAGGDPTPVTTLDASRGESSHDWPQFLPDGRHFLFFVDGPQPDSSGVYVASLDSTVRRRVLAARSNALYASGYLLFLREHALMAQPFDVGRLELTGEALPLADKVGITEASRHSLFSASDAGVLAYSHDPSAYTQLIWFDRTGQKLGPLPSDSGTRAHTNINLSPDGTHVAADRRDPQTGNRGIWLFDLARDSESRLTFGPANEASPVWSPDGSRLIFFSTRDGTWNLYQRVATGAGDDELLLKSNESKIPCDWSLDGRYIVFREWDPKTKWDLWVLPVTGDRHPLRVVRTQFEDGCGQSSPDGRWLAYASGEPGREEVYVQSLPPGSPAVGRWQISSNGGTAPRWRRDGKELFYLDLTRNVVAVPVTSDATFEAGRPKPLFQTRASGFLPYDVTADGQRFLVNTAIEELAPSLPAVILDWTAGLK